MADAERLGLLKETLKVIFGLNDDTIGKVVRIIKSSPDIQNARTQLIRTRVGTRAMKYLRNAVDIARDEGSEKHRDDDSEYEETKNFDLEKKTEKKDEKPKDGEVKETYLPSLKGFLNELDARSAARIMTDNNPKDVRRDRARKTDQQVRKDIEADIRSNEQSSDPDEKRLATLTKQVAMLRKKIAMKNKNQGGV